MIKIFLMFIFLAHPVSGQSPDNTGPRRDNRQGPSKEAQTFLGTFQTIRDQSLRVIGDSALWELAVNGLIQELEDPYAQVFTPEQFSEFQEGNTGNYAGIGVQITNLNQMITITAVFRGTPAERSGLLVGDLIIGVNDNNTEGWTTRMASDSIRGEIGTHVKIHIARKGLAVPLTPAIVRDSVHISPLISGIMGSGIGYIGLGRISRGSSQEVDSVLSEFKFTHGIIMDLRGNPGGYLDESIMISDLFLKKGSRLASVESRIPGEKNRDQDEAWEALLPDRIPNKPVIVLVDDFSASASEIIAGALQDHDRALIIGRPTFGKGVFQKIFRLNSGRHLRLTTGEWFTPLGRSLNRSWTKQGLPAREDPDTFPVLTTKSGRNLVSGGRIFPDLNISSDTLTLIERSFLSQAARDSVPITLRIEEFAFTQADALRSAGEQPNVDPVQFSSFIDNLIEEGIEEKYANNQEILDYIKWRVSARLAERMGWIGRSVEILSQRDLVLAEAVRILNDFHNMPDIFSAVKLIVDAEVKN